MKTDIEAVMVGVYIYCEETGSLEAEMSVGERWRKLRA